MPAAASTAQQWSAAAGMAPNLLEQPGYSLQISRSANIPFPRAVAGGFPNLPGGLDLNRGVIHSYRRDRGAKTASRCVAVPLNLEESFRHAHFARIYWRCHGTH